MGGVTGFTALALLAAAGSEDRAIAYLAREVPQWSKQNHCYSCHNNGDGARALYAARRRGFRVPAAALEDTTSWVSRPLEWDTNRGDPRFSDKRLARVQFAASLVEAFDAGLVRERKRLVEAAQSLLPHQEEDGSWPVDAEAAVGSPATYGPALATFMALRTLRKAASEEFGAAIRRAETWLGKAKCHSAPDAAAVVLALGGRRTECVDLLLRSQAPDGGWGPYAGSPPEAFDTAVALLALQSLEGGHQFRGRIERGREFLIRTQLPEGGWAETTRPPGSQSYAQHLSTTGWAALALIETPER